MSSGRHRQLVLIPESADRDLFLSQELDEFEAFIRKELAELREDLQARDDKANRRISAIQGMLIGALSSTTVAAVVGLINLAAR